MTLAGALVVGSAWLWGGARVGVLVTAGAVVCLTAATVAASRRRLSHQRRTAAEVARACGVLAGELTLGKIPLAALTAAAEDCPVLAASASSAVIGGDPVETWREQSGDPGGAGLGVLARAWRVATTTGAPLGPSLESVAEALRADDDLDRLVAGELAAPRLTGVILGLLPVAGVGLGYFVGGDPVGFLTRTPWGWGCLLGGTLLACAGVVWTERMAAREMTEATK